MKNLVFFSTLLFLIAVIVAQNLTYGRGGELSFDTDWTLLVSDEERSGKDGRRHPKRYVRGFVFDGVRCMMVERWYVSYEKAGMGVGLSCDWD